MDYLKHSFINDLEKKNGSFSILQILIESFTFTNFLRQKKMKIVYEKLKMTEDDKLINIETVFETKQNFFIHYDEQISQSINIYYKAEQYNELMIFIKQLKKQFKDGTNYN